MNLSSSDAHSPSSALSSAISPPVLHFRCPRPEDGQRVFGLVQRCKPLDENSMYCNVLQCSHFATTSVLAYTVNNYPDSESTAPENDGAEQEGIAGFISAYRLPQQPEVLFVWQVAVDSRFRGQGVATKMLEQLLERQQGVQYLHTTITAGNDASWQTFRRFARNLGADFNSGPGFDRVQHLGDQHDSEQLVVIGPFSYFSQRLQEGENA